MNKKLLSIITINFNNNEGLLNTIKSVVNQTFRDFEYIVIDGDSTDGSLEVIKEFCEKIDYWVSEPDKGIYHAMNKGVAVAKGDYCNFMNSGDCFYNSSVLEKVFLNTPTVDILIGKAQTPGRTILPPDNPTLSYFYKKKPINHQAAFIKKSLLNKYPYDEENYKIVSDTKFFVDALIIENCSYQSLKEFIVNFDDKGIGSANVKFNSEEQGNVLSKSIYPRVLEDYEKIQYSDYAIVQIAIKIARLFSTYGKFFKLSKYLRKIRKLIFNKV